MRTRFRREIRKIGLAPGTLVYTGEEKAEPARITLMDFDESEIREKPLANVSESIPFKKLPTVTWLNVDGIHDVNILQEIGEVFAIHPLIMEDILNTEQRPKADVFEDYAFIVVKMLRKGEKESEIISEQVSFILGKNFVISFQEMKGDTFDPIRDRIRANKGRVRKMDADYLFYLLIDSIVDNYFVILENFGERIETLDEEIMENPTVASHNHIHALKRDLIDIRRAIWPLREAVGTLEREETRLIDKKTHVFLRDLYDHTIQIIDTVESFRDMVSGLVDLYMSSVSNRMNEVMKVLTIIATIFIPITFIAGVYGMNFNPAVSAANMPELNWRWGYIIALGLMAAVAITMIIFFKRKKWL